MAQSTDRRVRKTKKAMSDALAKLLLEKPLNNISVREIADEADINRGTFYLHYRDVFDMAEQLQNEIMEKFEEIITSHESETDSENLVPMLADCFELISENADLAKVMLSRNGDAAFLDKMKNAVNHKFYNDVQKLTNIENPSEFDIFYNYIVYGFIGICTTWLENGMKESTLEIAKLTEKLILSNTNALA